VADDEVRIAVWSWLRPLSPSSLSRRRSSSLLSWCGMSCPEADDDGVRRRVRHVGLAE
jgi:hypothetical protein